MKKLILAILLPLALVACTTATPIYLIKTNCDNIETELFIDYMEQKFFENNFIINKSDIYNGFIQAEMYQDGSFVADPGLSQIAQYKGGDNLLI